MHDPDAHTDNVQGSARNTNAQTYFRAILTDPQIEALQNACAFFLDEPNAEWKVNPPSPDERHALGAAWAVLSNAEKIL